MTGGQYKGRRIITPSCVKPTLSKVREGVFNILMSHYSDFSSLDFLDTFAGSGIMGIEAISRGFKSLFAFEINYLVYKNLTNIYKNLGIDANLIKGDAYKLLNKTDKRFDVIYLDPPWDNDYLPLVNDSCNILNDNGIIILECDKKKANELYLKNNTTLLPFKEKIYGRSCVMFLIKGK